jgi:hypothetical protein
MKSVKTNNWEKLGCGKAPYRFVGNVDTAAGADSTGMVKCGTMGGYDVLTKPGGTCDVCGTYIVVFYNFVSSDGVKFHVGCECAEKAADQLSEKTLSAVQRAKKRHTTNLRKAREAKKLTELKELIAENKENYSKLPHPNKWVAEKGKTLNDYIEWMMEKAGTSGKIRLLKTLQSL